MSIFNSYEKVERIEKEECRGLLEGKSYIFEKIDGANAQIYLDASGEIAFGSRNRVLGIGKSLISGDSFRGFYPWVEEHYDDLNHFFRNYPNITLYGEWLVKHTIVYPQEFYKKFYIFDLYDSVENKFIDWENDLWNYLPSCAPMIDTDGIVENCNIEDLKVFLEKPSNFGASFREGVVIKNYDFINKYGRTPYGKLLHKDFQEVKSKTKKNVNPEDIEVELTSKYCTKARVVKICGKIRMNNVIKDVDQRLTSFVYDPESDKSKLEMKDIPKVMNLVFYDIITEDMNDILKNFKFPIIDFKKFKFLVFDIAKKYFVEYIEKQN